MKENLKYHLKRFLSKTWLANLLTRVNYEVLRDLIDIYGYTSFAEIGTLWCATSKYILKNCNINRIVCVDPYKFNITDYYGSFDHRDWTKESVTQMKKEAKEFAKKEKVEFYFKSSKEASKEIEDNSLDMVYIDADHTYEGVKTDIESWYPKIRDGGMICGHDYSILCFGVVRAVYESFKHFHTDSDDVWWVIKNKSNYNLFPKRGK